jgi:hypothetical protein
MLSALLMFRRVSKAFRYAVREDEFLNLFGAGVLPTGRYRTVNSFSQPS